MKSHQKSNGFTQSQVNTYPIPTHAIGIVAELVGSVVIDRYNRRLSLGLTICALQIACSIVLLIPNMSLTGNLTALYLSSTAYGINPLLYSWSSNLAVRTADDATRSVILALMAASDGLLWTFWGIVLYPADDAPYWRTGYIATICVCAVLCFWLFLVRWVCGICLVFNGQLTIYSLIDGPAKNKPRRQHCSTRRHPGSLRLRWTKSGHRSAIVHPRVY